MKCRNVVAITVMVMLGIASAGAIVALCTNFSVKASAQNLPAMNNIPSDYHFVFGVNVLRFVKSSAFADLRQKMPAGSELFLLMGADSFAILRAWHRASELPFLASLIVASRPGEPLDRLVSLLPDGISMEAEPRLAQSSAEAGAIALRSSTLRNAAGQSAPFYLLPGLHVEISASEIRSQLGTRAELRAVAEGQTPAHEMLPTAVADYIRAHRLYS